MNRCILRYGPHDLAYSVGVNDRLRSRVRIHVLPDASIVVESPPASCPKKVQEAVQKRARWIVRQVEEAAASREYALPRAYISGETHFYLGRRYKLKVISDRQLDSRVRCLRGTIEITLPIGDPAAVRRRLQGWLASRAREHFSARLSLLTKELPWLTDEPEFQLLRMEKQWGSCSPTGRLSLNPALVKAPRQCIDYVLIHELCHMSEHNHSKRFYALLDRHCPDWKARKANLDRMSELLLVS